MTTTLSRQFAVLGATAVALLAVATPASAATHHRAPHCGAGHINRAAPVISSGDIVIHASARTVFRIQTDVENWPTWQPDVTSAERLDHGTFRPGSTFHWLVSGLDITSTVRQVHPDRCTLWGGPGNGINAVHLWTYTPVRGGVLVHTEESWAGAPVTADPVTAQRALDNSLEAWRDNLKAYAEAT